jgi:hypothetical protein
LWPYSNGYDIYPGGCPDNDPDTATYSTYSTYTPFSVSQGVTSTDPLTVYGLVVTATSSSGHPVTQLQVTAKDASPTCSAPNNAFSTGWVTGNSMVIGIPLGTFSLTVTGVVNGNDETVGPIALAPETGNQLPPQPVTLP